MEQTECSETSAHKIQTPGNYPEENIQHTENGESLKSRNVKMISPVHCRKILKVMFLLTKFFTLQLTPILVEKITG
jgi:hypothetical protein